MNKTLIRHLGLASAWFIATLLLTMTPATAGTPDFGVRTGVYADEEEGFLGAEALWNVGQTHHWYTNPNVEHVFMESGGITAFSADFHYDLPISSPAYVWVGAGPTLLHRDSDSPAVDDDTDAGLNLLVGVGAKRSDVRPYGQLKVVVADDSQAVLGVGVRF